MNIYDLSRGWFDFCFENPEKINKEDILKHVIRTNKGYSKGGFYLIVNRYENKCYIGKSVNYMSRLKQHLYPSSNKTAIDIELNKYPDKFEFYILAKYEDLNINFFNRKLESVIEHRFITIALNNNHEIYNSLYYGHL